MNVRFEEFANTKKKEEYYEESKSTLAITLTRKNTRKKLKCYLFTERTYSHTFITNKMMKKNFSRKYDERKIKICNEQKRNSTSLTCSQVFVKKKKTFFFK